jgi:hypothetical protein
MRGCDVDYFAASDTNCEAGLQGIWQDPAVLEEFEKIARDGASAVGGLPVTLRLMTSQLDVKNDEVSSDLWNAA